MRIKRQARRCANISPTHHAARLKIGAAHEGRASKAQLTEEEATAIVRADTLAMRDVSLP